MRIFIVPVLALVWATGGSADGGDIKMLPGKWAYTVEIDSFDMPGAPAGFEEAMRRQVGRPQTVERCLTQEQSENVGKRFKEMLSQDLNSCKADSFSITGGKVTGKMTCESGGGVTSEVTLDGAYTETNSAMTVTTHSKNPAMKGVVVTMVLTMNSERIGDCDA